MSWGTCPVLNTSVWKHIDTNHSTIYKHDNVMSWKKIHPFYVFADDVMLCMIVKKHIVPIFDPKTAHCWCLMFKHKYYHNRN